MSSNERNILGNILIHLQTYSPYQQSVNTFSIVTGNRSSVLLLRCALLRQSVRRGGAASECRRGLRRNGRGLLKEWLILLSTFRGHCEARDKGIQWGVFFYFEYMFNSSLLESVPCLYPLPV